MRLSGWPSPQTLARRVEKSLEAQVRASHSYSAKASASTPTSSTCSRSNLRPCRPSSRIPSYRPALFRRPFAAGPRRPPAEDPGFTSVLDNPPELVRAGRRHGPGLIVLAVIPVTAFALGTWQVQRLGWKTELVARFEDRIVREPLPLPPRVDPAAVADFDYRRVRARGRYRHDREMLVGPRMRDGEQGYMVVTPLERAGDPAATVLVNRGWISKRRRRQQDRPESLDRGEVVVEGLLREPWKKNMFTPENRPDKGEFYFPDVKQMAELTGSQAVWIEQTMEPGLLQTIDMESKGIPIGRPAEVNLRNNHAQYIFTWYSL
ncbi:SURF1-domain-containing protein [Hypoxylon sp. FL1284]|nr:SURF1-domain-containing protein [Hypoxylon sp. FL1284]